MNAYTVRAFATVFIVEDGDDERQPTDGEYGQNHQQHRNHLNKAVQNNCCTVNLFIDLSVCLLFVRLLCLFVRLSVCLLGCLFI